MAELVLIVRMAGRRVAIPASEVEAVVELEGLTPAPRAAAHVAGLSALRSRVLTVIDAMASLELGCSFGEGLIEAVVVNSGGHPYALLVDEVEDVIETDGAPLAVRAPIGAGWDRVAIGMIDAGSDLLLLVDPHLVIAGPAAQAA
ncbi:chemotaxis protein CheW [Sphingosinicella sp. LHD-64]|uniref:chemotaxis protein CheW n=1 Tax=Sphingosinicella sp. LHD-64 TaxID=3072139 RepID=UPI00281011BC|nr:chemotaxis protein CheW [Sphingosinicella sp. LHD-64]MDQ8755614.1 chemotaxis protein CheW [Sphingosinicella sp. LHD-64]